MNRPRVAIRRLEHAAGLPVPAYQTPGAAGADLVAALPAGEAFVIKPGSYSLIPTGLTMELPPGLEAQVRPRSGLAAKFGVTVLNSPGTIDSDYRGEIKVILLNCGTDDFTIGRGDRIAQLIIAPVAQADFFEADALGASARGAGGFGSTGV